MFNTIRQFKALGDENRFRIVMMLRIRPLCVCEMLEVLDIAGSTLSNHLKILQQSDLIESRRDGRWIEYHLREDIDKTLFTYIEHVLKGDSIIERDRLLIQSVTRDVCSRKP